MTGIPALTMREARLAARDKHEGRHWADVRRCWCEAVHENGEIGTVLVAPPWSEKRHGGTVR
jgi:hypothetical protein